LNDIQAKKLENIFKNTSVVLKIFCTLQMEVFEAQRSFSKLGNQLKTWQEASTGHE
jgi:hypothetical protein